MKKVGVFGFVLVILLASSSVWATTGTVGLGAGLAPDYEGSEDYQGVPMLMFNHRYDSGRFVSLMGTRMKVNLLTDKTFSFGPAINYRMGRDDVDNNRVDAMRDIDDAFEVGAFGGINVSNLIFGLQYLADVSGGHDGYTTTASAGYRWKACDSFTMTPGIFATYADADYMDTFFSVDAKNRGTSGFADYDADSGIKDIGANLVAHLTPWENWGIMAVASYKRLRDDAADSPVVKAGDDVQWFGGLMATYRWGSKPAPVAKAAPASALKPTPEPAPVPAAPKDSDGDGVTDDKDKCPGTLPGVLVDADGCDLKYTLQIEFDFDKADIRPEYHDAIGKAAAFIDKHPETRILVAGHTDSVGEEDYNKQLSMKRAESLEAYMAENFGINADQLFPRGYGESRPVASNDNREGRQANRRVEFICCAIIPPEN